MDINLLKKLKNYADQNKLVMRLFCDNAMIYHYNSSTNIVSFDFDNGVFYSYSQNNNPNSYSAPVQLDIVELDFIQGVRFLTPVDKAINSISALSVPSIRANDILYNFKQGETNCFNHI